MVRKHSRKKRRRVDAVPEQKKGFSKEEALRRLNALEWTPAERATLKKAIDEAGEVFGYAGRD